MAPSRPPQPPPDLGSIAGGAAVAGAGGGAGGAAAAAGVAGTGAKKKPFDINDPSTWPGADLIGAGIGAGKNAVGAATDAAGFLSRLTSPNLWLRVGEVALGMLLLLVGINAMIKQETGTSPAGEAVKAGKKAGKVAAVAAV